MPIIVTISAYYAGDADQIFASALQFSEMEDAMRDLATYSGLPVSGTASQGDTFMVDVTFWGFLRVKGHQMHIERLDPVNRVIQSRECAPGIRRWDHHLSVQPVDGQVCWTDTVRIDAGWKTAFVARFAAYVYGRRHSFRRAIKVERMLTSN